MARHHYTILVIDDVDVVRSMANRILTGVALYADICARSPDVAVVFMSAYAAEILAARGQQNLTVPFLAKPFTPKELVAKVNATIQHRRDPGRRPRTSAP